MLTCLADKPVEKPSKNPEQAVQGLAHTVAIRRDGRACSTLFACSRPVVQLAPRRTSVHQTGISNGYPQSLSAHSKQQQLSI